jgi:hypothetical protein
MLQKEEDVIKKENVKEVAFLEDVKQFVEVAKAAFTDMPHIEEVWITKDGNYHLNDIYGGYNLKKEAKAAKK